MRLKTKQRDRFSSPMHNSIGWRDKFPTLVCCSTMRRDRSPSCARQHKGGRLGPHPCALQHRAERLGPPPSPQGAMQARMGHLATCAAPQGTMQGHTGHTVTCGASLGRPERGEKGAGPAEGHNWSGSGAVTGEGVEQSSSRHGGAPGERGYLRCTRRIPCKRTRGSWSTGVHPQVAMQAHMGHLVTCGAPTGCHAGTHGAPGQLRCTLKAPFRRRWGTWSTVVHPQSAMQAHTWGALREHVQLQTPKPRQRKKCTLFENMRTSRL